MYSYYIQKLLIANQIGNIPYQWRSQDFEVRGGTRPQKSITIKQ